MPRDVRDTRIVCQEHPWQEESEKQRWAKFCVMPWGEILSAMLSCKIIWHESLSWEDDRWRFVLHVGDTQSQGCTYTTSEALKLYRLENEWQAIFLSLCVSGCDVQNADLHFTASYVVWRESRVLFFFFFLSLENCVLLFSVLCRVWV